MTEPHGRSVMITGAGGGIGRACARMFAEQGAQLLVVDRDEAAATATAAAVAEVGGRAEIALAEVTRKVELQAAVARGVAAFGALDILLHAVGIGGTGTVEEMQEDLWDEILSVNLKSAFLASQAVLPGMRERRFGRIVLLTSRAAHKSRAGTSAYSASKGGLLAFARILAAEVGDASITVNCIAPGTTRTPMVERYYVGEEAQAREAVDSGAVVHPLRLTQPEEIAAAALYLCGPHSGHITGSTLHVNGGTFMP